jgi:lysyl-tRNA synthetase class 2
LHAPDAIREILSAHAVTLTGKESLGKLHTLLFETFVESKLIQPTFVINYPVDVSPLARRREQNPSEVERFELFIAGKEIANAFSELNDPIDQNERFLRQLEERRGDEEHPPEADEDYIRALEYGMPPTAGEGVGIDRLVMILTDSPSIRDVILFPLMRPEKT